MSVKQSTQNNKKTKTYNKKIVQKPASWTSPKTTYQNYQSSDVFVNIKWKETLQEKKAKKLRRQIIGCDFIKWMKRSLQVLWTAFIQRKQQKV